MLAFLFALSKSNETLNRKKYVQFQLIANQDAKEMTKNGTQKVSSFVFLQYFSVFSSLLSIHLFFANGVFLFELNGDCVELGDSLYIRVISMLVKGETLSISTPCYTH